MRGEKKIEHGEWFEPQENEKQYLDTDLTIIKQRKHFVEIQIKDNPFVKASPTQKIAYVLEQSEKVLKMRVVSKAKEVPYCDCFSIEEEFVCSMPEGCANSCVLRVTMTIIWHKSTMMKSIIASSSQKESKAVWTAYSEYVKKNGHIFKVKKIESKLSHKIEKTN